MASQSQPDSAPASDSDALSHTPLYGLHVDAGARMVPFAGYAMPVQYPDGIIAEHRWTRENAGLFDVSHMGQALLEGPGAGRALEALVPADIQGLAENRTRYTQLLNDEGGILDDLMVTRLSSRGDDERLLLVVNAACKHLDFELVRTRLPQLRLTVLAERALLALQGPKAAAVLARAFPALAGQKFMSFSAGDGAFETAPWFWRSGYTGEDGFEISVPGDGAPDFIARHLDGPEVKLAGLGARDSLRLEAGLCLYGHDIDETTSPVEAGLQWSIQKSRREGGARAGGFPGAERILRELKEGPARRRVGLSFEGRQPAREGADIATGDGAIIGKVTSGGFSPTLQKPIAMGYVASELATLGTALNVIVRGRSLPAGVTAMPFVPARYFKPAS